MFNLKTRHSLLALLVAALSGTAAHADVVSAQDPLGQLVGTWSNYAPGQNFMVQFTLTSETTLTGMSVYTSTNYANVGNTVSVKIRADNGAGVPDAANLVQFLDTIDSETALNSAIDRSSVLFDTGVTLAAGTYWIGMAGSNFDLTWASFSNGGPRAPLNQAVLSGDTYLRAPGITYNLAYSLEGTPANTNNVPEPASWALAAVALAGLGISRRRAAR